MNARLFHIFRNTPLGRETLLQSMFFCNRLGLTPVVYIPQHTKFLMYFDNDVVQVDLDDSYLTAPATAQDHARALLIEAGLKANFLDPKHFTASSLPDIPTNFDFMCCPRSISDLSSKIGLGYIGPRVRRIVNSARFPVLITSPSHKQWQRLMVFFGGSANAFKALKLGMWIARITGLPLDVFTQVEGHDPEHYRQLIAQDNLQDELDQHLGQWLFFESGRFEHNLYDVPHDALVIAGAFGHGLIRDMVFGSKLEQIQATTPNNLLVVGPNYTAIL